MRSKVWFSLLLLASLSILSNATVASALRAGSTDPNGFTRYSIDGQPKAHGLRMQFKIPSEWIQKQGEHPHVIVDFLDPDHKTDMIIVQVRDLGKENHVTRSDAADFAQSENAHEMLPDVAQITSAKRVAIDQWPALLIKGHMALNTSDLRVAQDFRWIMFLIDHHLVQVGASASGLASQGLAPLQKRMAQNEPLFRAVGSSIVLPSRWEGDSSFASTLRSNSGRSAQFSGLIAQYGENWWLVFSSVCCNYVGNWINAAPGYKIRGSSSLTPKACCNLNNGVFSNIQFNSIYSSRQPK